MTPLDLLMALMGILALVALVVCYTLDGWGRMTEPPQQPPAPWYAGYEDKEGDVQQEETTALYGLPNVYQKSYRAWLEEQNIRYEEGALYEDRGV